MIRSTLILGFTLFTIVSCSSKKEPIIEFPIGMENAVWTPKVIEMLQKKVVSIASSDSSSLYYKLPIDDSTFLVELKINDDDVQAGKIRMKTINFSTSNIEISKVDHPAQIDLLTMDTITDVNESYCPKRTYDIVFANLVEMYGKPDSIDKREKLFLPDENQVLIYFFHDQQHTVQLKRNLHEKNYGKGIVGYPEVEITIKSKSYESELETMRSVAIASYSLVDYFAVKFSKVYLKEGKNEASGLTSKTIWMQPLSVSNSAVADSRSVTGAKGTVCIVDQFGDTLNMFPDITIELPKNLESSRPGRDMNRAILLPVTYNLTVPIESFQVSNKLKQALFSGSDLSVRYLPTAVSFSDGTSLH